jgi:hypothetical protein
MWNAAGTRSDLLVRSRWSSTVLGRSWRGVPGMCPTAMAASEHLRSSVCRPSRSVTSVALVDMRFVRCVAWRVVPQMVPARLRPALRRSCLWRLRPGRQRAEAASSFGVGQVTIAAFRQTYGRIRKVMGWGMLAGDLWETKIRRIYRSGPSATSP